MPSGLPSMLEIDPTFDEEFALSFGKWEQLTGYDKKTRTYRREPETELAEK